MTAWYETTYIELTLNKQQQALMKEEITAGTSKRIKTCLSTPLPTRVNLKILLRKCTIPVNRIKGLTGKQIMNTGERIVPRPKPEKSEKGHDKCRS